MTDETPAQLIELVLFWGEDIVDVSYVRDATAVSLADYGVPSSDVKTPIALPVGSGSAETRAGAFTMRATIVRAPRRIGLGRVELRPFAVAFVDACVHALLLASFALRDANATDRDDVDLMRSYLARSDQTYGDGDALTRGRREGHDDDAMSSLGAPSARAEVAHAVRTDARDAPAPTPTARGEMTSLDEARSFGVISLLGNRGSDAPSPWATARADGNLWGTAIGDAFGSAGIDLSGVSKGGGGDGHGVDIAGVSGACDAACAERLRLRAGIGQNHTFEIVCHLRYEEPTIPGRLPADVIKRIVHQNFGRFRGCYEQGLAHDATLAGRVSTKFVIGRDGHVSAMADAGSDLTNASVTACVQQAFGALSFPEPAGGAVNVVYPITFSRD